MIDWRAVLAVGAGAAIGGVARLLITQLAVARVGPGFSWYATAFINVTGSFLIGAVIETAQTRTGVGPLWRAFLATGVLGGYTTFSTFSYEALTLYAGGFGVTALLYVLGSVALGIAGAFGGIATARALAP
ncbi:MAG TPA: CrcB family protein [Candidatus Baltobacteraceae bacterium]|nr:CrcB family protein [Candidatus Baltobacteraceae bacterium]